MKNEVLRSACVWMIKHLDDQVILDHFHRLFNMDSGGCWRHLPACSMKQYSFKKTGASGSEKGSAEGNTEDMIMKFTRR